MPLRAPKRVEDLLHQIPSQTTNAERRFLYTYFSSLWSGRGDVVEIGPFLGGTTRAMALGMLDNPRRDNDTTLYTFDRFQEYFEIERLRDYLQPVIERGVLSQADFDGLGAKAQFIDIFKAIHGGEDYYRCIEPSDHGVPDLLEQVASGEWMVLPEGFQTDAVFVDGCKSWFGTKYFMRLLAPKVNPGGVFLFQDFSWFTCFWLPVFIESFGDRFSLIGNVSNTYAFMLKQPLSAEEIDRGFADSPEEAGTERLVELIDRQIDAATYRQDDHAVIRHTIHKAGALAYLGELERARSVMRSVESLPETVNHKNVIDLAWQSPTYRPAGPIALGRE